MTAPAPGNRCSTIKTSMPMSIYTEIHEWMQSQGGLSIQGMCELKGAVPICPNLFEFVGFEGGGARFGVPDGAATALGILVRPPCGMAAPPPSHVKTPFSIGLAPSPMMGRREVVSASDPIAGGHRLTSAWCYSSRTFAVPLGEAATCYARRTCSPCDCTFSVTCTARRCLRFSRFHHS